MCQVLHELCNLHAPKDLLLKEETTPNCGGICLYPRTWEIEAGETLWLQSQPGLQSQVQAARNIHRETCLNKPRREGGGRRRKKTKEVEEGKQRGRRRKKTKRKQKKEEVEEGRGRGGRKSKQKKEEEEEEKEGEKQEEEEKQEETVTQNFNFLCSL